MLSSSKIRMAKKNLFRHVPIRITRDRGQVWDNLVPAKIRIDFPFMIIIVVKIIRFLSCTFIVNLDCVMLVEL